MFWRNNFFLLSLSHSINASNEKVPTNPKSALIAYKMKREKYVTEFIPPQMMDDDDDDVEIVVATAIV
jgi:hypothetical protein